MANEAGKLRAKLRTAVADYIASEGCSCCQGSDHREHREAIAKLLNVPAHKDQSDFYDFSKYETGAKK